MISADNLLESISGIMSPKNFKGYGDKHKFVNDIGGIAPKALNFAHFVRKKAEDSVSLWGRDHLRKLAGCLHSDANNLVDLGNKALHDPDTWGKHVRNI